MSSKKKRNDIELDDEDYSNHNEEEEGTLDEHLVMKIWILHKKVQRAGKNCQKVEDGTEIGNIRWEAIKKSDKERL
jgi:hypothetical protein